jgi:hypothetical protein
LFSAPVRAYNTPDGDRAVKTGARAFFRDIEHRRISVTKSVVAAFEGTKSTLLVKTLQTDPRPTFQVCPFASGMARQGCDQKHSRSL